MKLLKIVIAALGVTLASAVFADPPSVVGRLNYLSGPVSFAPAQAEEDWVAATLNRPITTGDRLWTDNNAFAEMHVGSLAVRMAPQTSVDVLNLDDRALQLRVAEGDVNLRVRRLPSGRLIEIATPSGAVVVRQPGSYRISVDGDSSTVTVRAGGQAEVFTAGSSILVRDAEEVAISRSRPELFAAAQPDEFDRWAADRDRRHDRVASTRYVPVEMTGYEDLDQYGEWRTVAEYGNLWIPTSVPTDWAPYRYGHWVWISPWGWTWVDDQPWGFAPSHYGRWVWYDNYWAWAPGRLVERPVYSPALVAFIGGANFSVSIGPAVGWVPLGYREPFIPWYTASPTYMRNVNVMHNVTNINTTNIRYVNRTAPSGVTVVSRENFIAARPVQQATINVPSRTLATAPVTRGAPVTQPQRTSFARQERGSRPPAQVLSREAVVVNRPPALAQEVARVRGRESAPRIAASAQGMPVRVIERRERVNLQANQAPRAETRAARRDFQPPRADAPAAPQRQPQAVQEREREQQQQRAAQAQEQREREQQQQKAAQTQAQREREQQQQREREQQQQKGAQAQAQREREQQQQREREQQQQKAAQTQAQREREQQQQREREQQQQKAAQTQAQREREQQQQREREQQQKAAQAQEQREREQQQQREREQQQQRAAQAQREQQQQQQRAEQEQQRAQQAAQKAQQEQQRAQQDQQRAQQAAAEAQKAQQEAQRGRERERAEKAAQEQQRAQQAAQKAQQEQQRAQQEQARAQQEQQRAQQAAQKAQKEQQRAQRPEAAQAAPKPEAQEAEKGKRERGRKDPADKD